MNKKLISAVLVSGLLFIPVAGQTQSDSSKGIERMSKELGLTVEQRPKVEAIFNKEKKKVDAIFDEEKQKLQVVQEETRSSLKEVLTPEQMEKLDKKMRQQTRKNSPQKK
jgi:Spy/CpxP family protein refolding chaperone